jgi:hypothetical protein
MDFIKKTFVVGLVFGSFFVYTDKVFAATIHTGGNCSFVQAVLSAETNASVGGCTSGSGQSNTIILTQDEVLSSSYGSTNNALPIITTNIMIDGGNNTVTNNSQEAGLPMRIFEVNGGSLTLKDIIFQNNPGFLGHVDKGSLVKSQNGKLRISGVSAFDFSSSSNGGAIYTVSTPVSISNSLFQFSGSPNGGVLFMYDGNILTVSNSQFRNNSSELGGAFLITGEVSTTIDSSSFIQNHSTNHYGAIAAGYQSHQKKLVIKNSEFEGNTSVWGGAVSWGGWDGEVEIQGTTFFNNKGFIEGAAFHNGDAVGKISIINSTFSENESFGRGSAILNGGEEARFIVAYNSFVNNFSNSNEGTFTSFSPLPWTSSVLENNLFFGNNGGDCNFASEVNLVKIGNLSDSSCGTTQATGIDTNLANNGGPTRTHKLLQGSNAIDTAVTTGVTVKCPKHDQRGYIRGTDGNGDGVSGCDVGAYEVERRVRPIAVTVGKVDIQSETEKSIVRNESKIENPGSEILKTISR